MRKCFGDCEKPAEFRLLILREHDVLMTVACRECAAEQIDGLLEDLGRAECYHLPDLEVGYAIVPLKLSAEQVRELHEKTAEDLPADFPS